MTTLQAIPPNLSRTYSTLLARKGVEEKHRPHYLRWIRFYLDFCAKYRHPHKAQTSVPLFLAKLREKQQDAWKRKQAQEAVGLYLNLVSGREENAAQGSVPAKGQPKAKGHGSSADQENAHRARVAERPKAFGVPATSIGPAGKKRSAQVPARNSGQLRHTVDDTKHVSSPLRRKRDLPRTNGASERWPAKKPARAAVAKRVPPKEQPQPASTGDSPAQESPHAVIADGLPRDWPDLYARLSEAIQIRHYSPKTLKSYKGWTRKFHGFTRSKNPVDLSVADVKAFLTYLAVDRKVAASSQNVAFNSLLFLFRHVLHKEFGKVDGVVRAKKRPYIPVVLSREEIERLFAHLPPPCDRVAKLLYGCGLRLFECLQLRVQDVNFDTRLLTVHDGKGKKDRTLPLPEVLVPELCAQLDSVIALHREDLAAGYAGTFLPNRLDQKYRSAARELAWQWFFPADKLTLVPAKREYRRYHMHQSVLQKVMKEAVRKAQIPKRASAHTLRHSFASHLLQANYDIRTIQKLLGHSDVRTTMIYTNTVPSTTLKEVKSPLDL